MRRRTFVELTAAGSVVTLGAGCVGGEEDEPADVDDDSEPVESGGGDDEPPDESAADEDDGDAEAEYVDAADGQVELAYGEPAELSNGVSVTPQGVVEVAEQLGDAQPDEAGAFAVLELAAENGGDEEARLPDPTDPGLFLLYDDQQVEPVFRYEVFSSTEYEEYDGGDLQGGVHREGHILFGVDAGVSPEDIDFLWQDDFLVASELEGDIDVRWTAE